MSYNYDVKKPNDFNVLGGSVPIFRFLTKAEGDPDEQENGNINAVGDFSDEVFAACTFVPATNTVSLPAHTYTEGQRVKLTGVPLPTGFKADTLYYVRNPNAGVDFQLSLYKQSSIIEFTETGTTTQIAKSNATDFCITSKPGFWYVLNRMLITVRDEGSFDSGSYGNGVTLTNGVKLINGVNLINGVPSGIEFDITQGLPIRKNPEWGSYCYDVQISSYGQGENYLNSRWTFERMGRPVILDGDNEEFACIRLNDDFSALTGHYFQLQGLIQKKVPLGAS